MLAARPGPGLPGARPPARLNGARGTRTRGGSGVTTMDAASTEVLEKRQHLLFDWLPESQPARRVARRPVRPAAEASGEPVVPADPPPRAVPVATVPAAPPPAPAAFDPAALTNPELRALVQALPDLRLSHLIVEAARELKRRVSPDPDDDEEGAGEPNPSLLRAARLAVGELSGEDA